MPLPAPEKNEDKRKFLDRCMGNKTMNSEYPKQDQRYAVCHSQWDNRDSTQHKFSQQEVSVDDLYARMEIENMDAIGRACAAAAKIPHKKIVKKTS